ncbi:MAG: N-methyl-L-tryptophan oxidase [Gemmatimonadaceae bacterium]
MSPPYDVIVIGLGIMGGAASYTLARRGLRVLGIDRFVPPHALGSSHGQTRMIREAYFENPLYVPLVRRAYTLWEELGREAGGRTFLKKTGGIYIGERDSNTVKGALATAMQFRIPHEILSAGKLHRRFPAFAPLDEWVGLFELRAGVLLAEPILEAYLELARQKKADFKLDEEVRAIESVGGFVRVTTTLGTYEATQAIVAAGPWAPDLLRELALPLTVERQVAHWFDPSRDEQLFGFDRMPVSMWEFKENQFFYTMPDAGEGVKVGVHHGGATTTPNEVNRTVSSDELAYISDMLRRFVPFAKGRHRGSMTCLYTNTSDGHFIIDRHPSLPEVLVMSACSGHGFKFASVLAECVADLVAGRPPAFDLSPFALSRFAPR